MTSVQEIRKIFEENLQLKSKDDSTRLYNKKVTLGHQYKSLTNLVQEQEEDVVTRKMENNPTTISINNPAMNPSKTEAPLDYETIQNNDLYENIDNFSVEARKKNRAFKSKTQLEDKNKSDDSKYYSQPNQIRTNHEGLYENIQPVRDSLTSNLEHIVNELVETEESFVSKLRDNYKNYKTIFENNEKLPKSLIGKKYVLFRTIEEILDFHENEMLPMLQNNKDNLSLLCFCFSKFIEENKFYPHLLFIMHKRRAESLCKYYKTFFDEKAKEFNDNLGIISLLIQPLHRVTKYPLLFQQIIKECFKNFNMKPILQMCCITEKKMSDFVKLINESERIGNIVDLKDKINLYEEGRLKKVDKFYIYDYNLQRRFKARVFLFEKSLVYTEIVSKLNSEVLKYRGIYPCDKLSIAIREPGFTLIWDKRKNLDCDFEAKTEDIKNAWITTIKNLIVDYLEKKHLQSKNYGHHTAYNHLFRYRFLNSTNSRDSTISTTSSEYQNNNRKSTISTGSFHSHNSE